MLNGPLIPDKWPTNVKVNHDQCFSSDDQISLQCHCSSRTFKIDWFLLSCGYFAMQYLRQTRLPPIVAIFTRSLLSHTCLTLLYQSLQRLSFIPMNMKKSSRNHLSLPEDILFRIIVSCLHLITELIIDFDRSWRPCLNLDRLILLLSYGSENDDISLIYSVLFFFHSSEY